MQLPRPESRISALEKRTSVVEVRIEELASDTSEELRAISQDLKKVFEHMHKGFEQAHAYIQENIEATIVTKEELSKLETRIDDKMTAMESRINANIAEILDAIKQQKLGGEQ